MSLEDSGVEPPTAEPLPAKPPASKLRPALQWWQNCLMDVSFRQAEQIRNEPLQEIHALTRQIELASLTSDAPPAHQLGLWLSELQGLYSNLETVSNQLAAPQLMDLGLAIRQRLDVWQVEYSPLIIRLNGQTNVGENDANGLVLRALETLLKITLGYSQAVVELRLSLPETDGSLAVSIPLKTAYQHLPASIHQQLAYLEASFSYLSEGSYMQQEVTDLKQKKYLNCFFRWPMISNDPLHSDRGIPNSSPLQNHF